MHEVNKSPYVAPIFIWQIKAYLLCCPHDETHSCVFCARSKARRERAIVLTKMLYARKARRYLPRHLSVSHTHGYTHTHYLHSASPPGWSVQSRLLTKEQKQQKAELGPETKWMHARTHTHAPVSMTNCTLEGEWENESSAQYKTDCGGKLGEPIKAAAPGVVCVGKYPLSLKEMKYKTLLMNLNGAPFPLKGWGMDDKV